MANTKYKDIEASFVPDSTTRAATRIARSAATALTGAGIGNVAKSAGRAARALGKSAGTGFMALIGKSRAKTRPMNRSTSRGARR